MSVEINGILQIFRQMDVEGVPQDRLTTIEQIVKVNGKMDIIVNHFLGNRNRTVFVHAAKSKIIVSQGLYNELMKNLEWVMKQPVIAIYMDYFCTMAGWSGLDRQYQCRPVYEWKTPDYKVL